MKNGSYKTGDSEVEQMAYNICRRRATRYPLTKQVRLRLLKSCRKIAIEQQYEKRTKIHYTDLLRFHDEVMQQVEHDRARKKFRTSCHKWFGMKSSNEQLSDVLSKAIELMQSNELHTENADDENEFFHYEEFVYDHVHVQSPYPWMRPGLHRPIIMVFLFYLMTPVWFCHISLDPSVCHRGPGGSLGSGWVACLYFASKTLSTVGYGDVSVSKDNDWHIFVGIVYMILSNFVLVVGFSSAVDQTFHRLKKFNDRLIDRFMSLDDDDDDDDDDDHKKKNDKDHEKSSKDGLTTDEENQQTSLKTSIFSLTKRKRKKDYEGDYLHKKIKNLRMAMLAQLTLQYACLNLIGVFAVRIHILASNDPADEEAGWSWMTSFYWAVQTTTTIGE